MGAVRNEWDSKSFFGRSFTETEKLYRGSGKRRQKEGLQRGREEERKKKKEERKRKEGMEEKRVSGKEEGRAKGKHPCELCGSLQIQYYQRLVKIS